MNFLFSSNLIACLLVYVSFIPAKEVSKSTIPVSPLASYSTEWNNAGYLKCNTAESVKYMTAAEKEVIYILNLARTNPTLFANTVVKEYPVKTYSESVRKSTYYTGLLDTMKGLKPLPLLNPDSLCFAGAFCHALYSGTKGSTGHKRATDECRQKAHFNGECCDYGHNKPLDIIMSFLIDEGVESLGHRDICFTPYKKIGVSIQTHALYQYTAVLDFLY